MSAKTLLGIQSLILFGGTVFAWSKLLPQFSNVPHMLSTACFYGSSAFLVALFWSVRLYQQPAYESERWLRNFLLLCVVFAASVVSYECVSYFKLFGVGTTAFICAPGVHPLQTPCFTGMLFFLAAFITSFFATRQLRV